MEVYKDTSAAAAPRSHHDGARLPLRATLTAVGVLIAALAWAYFSVVAAEKHFESEKQTLSERLDGEKTARLARARQALVQQTDEAYRLFGTALGWTVSSAMMRGNRDEIEQYFAEVVKHERVRLVLLADPNDKVVVSSDRNFEDFAFSRYFPAALLQEPAVAISPGEGSLRRLVVPVRGLTGRVGTVLLVYEGPSLPEY